MKLSNFSIIGEHGIGIEIEAFGVKWNLHDSAFLWLRHDLAEAKVHLEWETGGYLALQEDTADRFGIVFHDVYQFEVSARDPEMPLGEDLCLDFISGVSAPAVLAETVYHGYHPTMPLTPDFLLFLTFRGGQRILIGADHADFVLLPAKSS